ncbi:FKBP-type peptidyl-prolyl cis-trans isomerase [Truepera radiovictrix]|jgi:FKBP-type peptidyl-prolyl cis-trans isomerase 2|uniref:Peptidyl-prolyl cis-trans isomerase n=1 Tax=Truepera radiovictrix (strain DSM 17093 / CIP 108686 / LMG 22925 / RQ-24) TaxID=649638 RepID=D7CT68_TRURR|nr:peptidylprolyl isomerase [Truepera radiovictrix]ADI15531.1 peptidylprolyl isomerase FKBP-type [Truepera radiovictrix DSM 17093]WMT55918.1 peptidylprolyl isomerase [Truepera radiovictrix]
MTTAKQGDTVRVHYRGTLADGREFDASFGREPLEFTLGAGEVIAGFDKAVTGLAPGQSRTAHISADEAYGPHREEMVLEVPRDNFPDGITPEAGQQLELTHEDGQRIPVLVTAVSEASVTLDANHPLAGHDLTFEVELVEIV